MKKTLVLFSILLSTLFIYLGCEIDPPSPVDQSSFSAGADVTKFVTDPNFTQAASGVEGSGTTVYSSDNVDVVTVDFLTGEVDIRAYGVAVITAYNTGDQSFHSASDSYTVTVKDPRFITTWRTLSANQTITIPTDSSSTYNYSVDWGDGTSSSTVTGNAPHTYAEAGIYTVIIEGLFPRILFDNGYIGGSNNSILTIEQWGTNRWTSMDRAFYGCSNLTVNAVDSPDLSDVTDMYYMFTAASSFNSDISHWDVSTVTNMGGLFWGASSFNSDISGWNVSNVTNMDNMLRGTAAFTNHDLSGWNVTNVNTHTDFSTDWGAGNTEPIWP